jgi:hypothetical protein
MITRAVTIETDDTLICVYKAGTLPPSCSEGSSFFQNYGIHL